MSHVLVVDLARNAITLALLLAGPLLAIAMGIGLVVSVIQAVTRIQEQKLSCVSKRFGMATACLVALPSLISNVALAILGRAAPQLNLRAGVGGGVTLYDAAVASAIVRTIEEIAARILFELRTHLPAVAEPRHLQWRV